MEKHLRILLITLDYPPPVLGGYEVMCAQVANFLSLRGHKVLVLTRVPEEQRRAVTVACGSHWNAMYYDHANNVICFAGPCAIWDYLPHSFEGFTFARFLPAVCSASTTH